MHTKLKIAREKAGLSQPEVALALGKILGKVSKAAISQWENEDPDKRSVPRLDKLRILAKLYNVKISALVDDELNLEGIHDTYTLDDAPTCANEYLLRIGAMDLDGAQNGSILRILEWNEENARDAVIVVYKRTGHKRSMLLQLAYNGDDVCFVAPRLSNDGQPRDDHRFTKDDGEVLGVVRSMVHDPRLWRGN